VVIPVHREHLVRELFTAHHDVTVVVDRVRMISGQQQVAIPQVRRSVAQQAVGDVLARNSVTLSRSAKGRDS
jgi:hypothetical protein